MIETILLAMMIAKIKGYKLKPLFKSPVIYPILFFLLIYIVIEVTIFFGNYSLIKYSSVFETAYLFMFLGSILLYKQYVGAIIGSLFMLIGTALNRIAISVNSGKMPVFPTLSYITGYVKPDAFTKVNDIHILGSKTTRLKFLTDVIDLGYSILSVGDVFIRAFTFIIILDLIRCINIQDMPSQE